MSTLHLVAPDYRDAASLIPIFDYDSQPVAEIRHALLQAYAHAYGDPASVAKQEVSIPRADGEGNVRALLYRPASGRVRAAIVHAHGGGWLGGSADMLAAFCAELANRHDVVVLSVDYRLVPEHRGGDALEDCVAALHWLRAQSGQLGFAADNILVMGDSAGGNLAAGLALRARDAGIPLRAQLLIYPALDDRTGRPDAATDNTVAGEFVLPRRYLQQLWEVRMTDVEPEQGPYLAPARMANLADVAPTFIAVGSLDLLADEALTYASRLGRVGVPIELHVYDGVFHGFDLIPGAETDSFKTDLARAIEKFLSRPE